MNDEQIANWNGASGLRWTQRQRALDRALGVFGRAALERAAPRPRERVLDVGCGCGDSTLALAELVGDGGSVLGVDVSAPMLARARERARGQSSIRFEEADASRVNFSPEFDLIFSRFGVMFFDDVTAAFSHLHSALREGGRLAFVCWRAFEENPWVHIPVAAVERTLSHLKRDDGERPGPFAFADPLRLEQRLVEAGFTAVAIDRFDADLVLSEDSLDDAVDFALNAGPAARLLGDVSAEERARVSRELERTLAPQRSSRGFSLGGSSWVVSARSA